MQQYETKTFQRLAKSELGPGESTLYFTDHGETLGYIDLNEERTQAAVTVCDPYKGTSRHYDYRDIEKAQAILDRHVKKQGYEAPVEEDEAAQLAEKQINEQWHDFTEEAERGPLALEDARPYTEEGLKKLLDDINAVDDETPSWVPSPLLCPRCGINELEIARPALNARSRHLPIAICSPCGTHESLSEGGVDLWHDQHAVVAALRAQDEARARNTLCELTPAQSSAVRAAVVWP